MCFMQKVSSLLRLCFFTATLIWYHTQAETAHSGASRLTHPYNIYLHQLLYAHTATFVTLNDYFPPCLFFSKIIHLQNSLSVD